MKYWKYVFRGLLISCFHFILVGSIEAQVNNIIASKPESEINLKTIDTNEILIPQVYECPIKGVDSVESIFSHKHFITLNELPLDKTLECAPESFRLFNFHSLANPSMAFFFKRNDKYYVRYKNITNCSWFNKEAKVVTREHEVNKEDWEKIRELLKRIDFWNLAREQGLHQREMPWDPYTVVIEAFCNGQYHCVVRITGGAYCFGEAFLEIFKIAERNIFYSQDENNKQ